MNPLSRLPLECLQHILHLIVSSAPEDPESAFTLLSLCTVNRHIAMVTFPVLYRDPFQLLYTIPDSREKPRPLRERSLLRTLLTKIQQPIATESDIDTSPSCSSEGQLNNNFFQIDYLSLVRNLTPPRTNYRKFDFKRGFFSKQRMWNIYFSEYMSICPPFLNNADYDIPKDPQEWILCLCPIVIYRELIWTLQNPILEQLESLTIPMSDVRRYQDVVHRLENLKRVHIIEDLWYGCGQCGHRESCAYKKSNSSVANKTLVHFLDDHAQFFFPVDGQHCRGRRHRRVNDVTISLPKKHYGVYGAPTRDYVKKEVLHALPPLHRPRAISRDDWKRINVRWTDLSLVRWADLSLVYWTDLNLAQSIDRQQDILKWCRGLESLTLDDLKDWCFDWAVEEKRDLERIRLGGSIGGLQAPFHNGGPSSGAGGPSSSIRSRSSNVPGNKWIDDDDYKPLHPTHLTHGLIPLSKVNMKRCNMPSNNLDILLDAFSHSLESLTISSIQAPETILPILIGHNWVDLPCLTHLEIHFPQDIHTRYQPTPKHRLVLDRLLFARCPSLQTVKVRDGTYRYSYDDIVPCPAADLPRLRILHLTGWSALTFHPATLETTKELEVLRLTMDPCRDGFIPPVEELTRVYGDHDSSEDISDSAGDQLTTVAPLSASPLTTSRRPHWTWDWYLPCLTHLLLASEFAYRFKFTMLHECPALEKLHLHIKTSTYRAVPHSRVISKSDIVFITGAVDNASSAQRKEESIVVCEVEEEKED
ncbi:hypothetical protein BGZ97_002497 [Linnemannia gamsii]|uniref:Uncharacterized protein n=1 Tax=Linnemannia gamsii TaxID=64522 RepID=A0A9P6UTP2_9FUNG|nr:hypothetical protein BGZ97_002497 [Linnemannia gamsii]